jgi:hypothetical protein
MTIYIQYSEIHELSRHGTVNVAPEQNIGGCEIHELSRHGTVNVAPEQNFGGLLLLQVKVLSINLLLRSSSTLLGGADVHLIGLVSSYLLVDESQQPGG